MFCKAYMLFSNICGYFSLDENNSVVIEFSIWNNERNINVPYLIYVNLLKPINCIIYIEWSDIRCVEESQLNVRCQRYIP